MTMKKIINTEKAPAPIGPYNQAVSFNNLLYTSGQIAFNPETGTLYEGGDIKEETKQVMENLEAVLHAARISLDRKSTRLNSSHVRISYAVFCLKKKKKIKI